MNVKDYWPMAREYSVWNTTVAALQFWTADLKAHVYSSTIEQVHNTFFYSTSPHILCQQSDEVLFGHFVTTLNAAFESKLALEVKDMRVVVKILTQPLLLENLPESTMFLVMKISLLIQQHHAAQVPASHMTNLYGID